MEEHNKSSADLTDMTDLDFSRSCSIKAAAMEDDQQQEVCDDEEPKSNGGFFDFWRKKMDEEEKEMQNQQEGEEEQVNAVAQFLQDRADTFWNNIDILAEEVGLKNPEEEMPDHSNTTVSTTLSDSLNASSR